MPGARVLIVEDDSALNALLTEWLTGEGYRCASAWDGSEALERFEELRPDAVLLDLNLPRIHGFEVLHALRERTPRVVVVAMSGFGGEQPMELALRYGAEGFLPKPIRRDVLLERLKHLLETAERDRVATAVSAGRWSEGLGPGELAELFWGAPAALVCVGPGDRIAAVNRAASRLVGRRPEDLLGCAFGDLVVEEVRAFWPESVRQRLRLGVPYEGEVFLAGAGGRRLPGVVVAEHAGEDGRILLSLRDLTAQKRMEEKLYESRKLASLGKVVEGVAHEVRNPLISVGGFARKARGHADAAGEQYLDVVLSEVRRLEKMVSDIEEYVHFTNQRRPRFVPVDLTELLGAVVVEFRKAWEGSGIRVGFDPAASIPPIYGDQELLRALFRGLAENAFDAMPAGGDLSILIEASGQWVHVRVADTGVGIAEEALGEVFDPFVTSKTAGAGLGLAKAYIIVEEHAGSIEFESQVGKGTVCTVSLPMDRRRVPRVAS